MHVDMSRNVLSVRLYAVKGQVRVRGAILLLLSKFEKRLILCSNILVNLALHFVQH